ncbi:hypothetical protein HMPREF0977_00727 [Clostridium sp. 1_1_41A1FAA]|nr:hypothetical protein HMPREF0977_00727 [Clostridium sp. 1_1_41A1FAA]
MKVSRRFQLTVQTVLFIAVYSDKKRDDLRKYFKGNEM